MATVSFTLNGRVLRVEEGTTVLQAARDNQVDIPTLCFLEGLSIAGSCRLCNVAIEGQTQSVPACSTVVRNGMVVDTDNDRLRTQRRFVLNMLFAQGHHVCAICVYNSRCELQSLAQELGITTFDFPNRRPEFDLDLSHERYGFDPNRCVLCTRCVRACAEIEGLGLWSVVGRGSDAHLEINQGFGWGLSNECTRCGKCVQSCPTGALFGKYASAGEMVKKSTLVGHLAEKREQR